MHQILFSPWTRPVLLIVILIVAWDLAIRIFGIKPYLIPSPESVIIQLYREWGKLWREALVTTYATLGGFALSIVFGIAMALLIAYSRTVESFCLSAARILAKRAQDRDRAAFCRLVRLRDDSKGHLRLHAGLLSDRVDGRRLQVVEPDMLDLARSMKASRLSTFVRISLPQALPSLFAGSRCR